MSDSPADIARTWLRAWDTGDLGLLRLAPDFVHTSPFGRIEGAEEYMRIVIEGEGRAAITYELETPAGTVEACDWVYVENGLIQEVNGYYDSVTNRAALEGMQY